MVAKQKERLGEGCNESLGLADANYYTEDEKQASTVQNRELFSIL